MTRFSVVVTNWNYRDFVAEAVDSALAQRRPPEQVVVVDDGSTDGSPDLLRERYGGDPRVTLLLGDRRRGQLGAFQLGVGPARGDVICFLDSDDRWEPDYLERIGALYDERSDVDVVFSDARRFGREAGTIAYADAPRDMGYTAVVTYGLSVWCGGPTSALSLRAPWARRSLDLPEEFLPDWRISADSCLVLGSSLLGARKYFLPTGCVGYRVHDRNGSRERAEEASPAARYLEKRNIRRLIGHYARAAGIDDSCLELARFEFRTMSYPDWRDAWRYVALNLRSPAPWWNRVEGALDVLVAWIRAR
jgi:glycosyltransferase involved in cell wall biosynthesis